MAGAVPCRRACAGSRLGMPSDRLPFAPPWHTLPMPVSKHRKDSRATSNHHQRMSEPDSVGKPLRLVDRRGRLLRSAANTQPNTALLTRTPPQKRAQHSLRELGHAPMIPPIRREGNPPQLLD
jgi:hypothetical protein